MKEKMNFFFLHTVGHTHTQFHEREEEEVISAFCSASECVCVPKNYYIVQNPNEIMAPIPTKKYIIL